MRRFGNPGGFRRVERWIVTAGVVVAVWGPPRLRPPTLRRSPTAALDNPLSLDVFGVVTVLLVALVVGSAALVLLAGQGPTFKRFLDRPSAPLRWYLLYTGVAVLSSIYSPSPLYTLFFALRLAALPVLLYWFIRQVSSFYAGLAMVVGVFSVQSVAIGILLVVRPEWVGEQTHSAGYRVTGGVFGDYGGSALILFLGCLALVLYSNRARIRMAAFVSMLPAGYLIAVAKTRSTIAAAAVGAMVMIWTLPQRGVKSRLLIAVGALSIALAGQTVSQTLIDFVTRSGDGLATASGRTTAFAYLWSKFLEQPLAGFGFAAGARFALVGFLRDTSIGIGAAHDALSKVLIDLGLVGLAVLVPAVVLAGRGTWRAWQRLRFGTSTEAGFGALLIAFFSTALLQGLAGEGVSGGSVLFVCVVATLPWVETDRTRFHEASHPQLREGWHRPAEQRGLSL